MALFKGVVSKNGKPVSSVIAETLPNTAILAVSAIAIAMVLGIFLGVLSVLFKDQFLDRFIQLVSTLGMSVPSFFSAILFAWIFGFVLREYTHLNMTGSMYEVDDFGEEIYSVEKPFTPSHCFGNTPLGSRHPIDAQFLVGNNEPRLHPDG